MAASLETAKEIDLNIHVLEAGFWLDLSYLLWFVLFIDCPRHPAAVCHEGQSRYQLETQSESRTPTHLKQPPHSPRVLPFEPVSILLFQSLLVCSCPLLFVVYTESFSLLSPSLLPYLTLVGCLCVPPLVHRQSPSPCSIIIQLSTLPFTPTRMVDCMYSCSLHPHSQSTRLLYLEAVLWCLVCLLSICYQPRNLLYWFIWKNPVTVWLQWTEHI